MEVYLVVMDGPKSGLKVQIHEGFTIGRKAGDLLLENDRKVSSLHAKVTLDNKGQFLLIDQESANGFTVNERKVRKVALLPGVMFRLGGTHFQVVHVKTPAARPKEVREALKPKKETVIVKLPTDSAVMGPKTAIDKKIAPKQEPPPKPIKVKPKNWKEKVSEILEQQPNMISSVQEPDIGVFSPALMLDFLEGVQADEKITLGYGPREAGFGHLDVELKDPDLPVQAFQLMAVKGKVQIRDMSGGILRVNNRSIEVTFLQDDDIITIGKTKIKVRYL